MKGNKVYWLLEKGFLAFGAAYVLGGKIYLTVRRLWFWLLGYNEDEETYLSWQERKKNMNNAALSFHRTVTNIPLAWHLRIWGLVGIALGLAYFNGFVLILGTIAEVGGVVLPGDEPLAPAGKSESIVDGIRFAIKAFRFLSKWGFAVPLMVVFVWLHVSLFFFLKAVVDSRRKPTAR